MTSGQSSAARVGRPVGGCDLGVWKISHAVALRAMTVRHRDSASGAEHRDFGLYAFARLCRPVNETETNRIRGVAAAPKLQAGAPLRSRLMDGAANNEPGSDDACDSGYRPGDGGNPFGRQPFNQSPHMRPPVSFVSVTVGCLFTSDNQTSLGPELQGAAHERVSLFAGLGRQGARLGVSGHRHPVDSGRGQRFVARHPRPEIHEHHHAARCGLCLSVHGATFAVRGPGVTRTNHQNNRRTSQ